MLVLNLSLGSAVTISHSEKLDTQLRSGNSYVIPVEIIWNQSERTEVSMNMSIEAENTDTEGINANIAPKRFVLAPNTGRKVSVKLNTSIRLVPDNFTFIIQANTLESQVSNSKQSRDGKPAGSGGGGASTLNTKEDPATGLSVKPKEMKTVDQEESVNRTYNNSKQDGTDYRGKNKSSNGLKKLEWATGSFLNSGILEIWLTLILLVSLPLLYFVSREARTIIKHYLNREQNEKIKVV